jgi:hypothetical protein
MTEPAVPREERRRAPRYQVHDGEQAMLPVAGSVRILDISEAGVLVESAHRVREGIRGRLRLDFGGRPFSADVQVQRVFPAGRDRFRIGAAFINLSPEHAATIARLIPK